MATIEKGQPFSPGEIINYSSNSVVSQTILKLPSGNVTLFSFDKGEGLSEHSSPHDAFIVITDGSAEISIDGKPNIVSKASLLFCLLIFLTH